MLVEAQTQHTDVAIFEHMDIHMMDLQMRTTCSYRYAATIR